MGRVCKQLLDFIKCTDKNQYLKIRNLYKCTCKSVCSFKQNNHHFYEIERTVPRHLKHKYNNNNNNNNNNEDK